PSDVGAEPTATTTTLPKYIKPAGVSRLFCANEGGRKRLSKNPDRPKLRVSRPYDYQIRVDSASMGRICVRPSYRAGDGVTSVSRTTGGAPTIAGPTSRYRAWPDDGRAIRRGMQGPLTTGTSRPAWTSSI